MQNETSKLLKLLKAETAKMRKDPTYGTETFIKAGIFTIDGEFTRRYTILGTRMKIKPEVKEALKKRKTELQPA